MPKKHDTISPHTFFLNEQHELSHAEMSGGGSLPKFGAINWATKGRRISKSLRDAQHTLAASPDPVKNHRYFLLATPVPKVPKLSVNKKKAPSGTYQEATRYSGSHSLVFRRLGLDLIAVHDDGKATVHVTTDRVERLVATTETLAEEGARERARWATIDAFSPVPRSLRVDEAWLTSLSSSEAADVMVEFHPMLTRSEIEDLIRALADVVPSSNRKGEGFTGNGSDFSGRQWLRGRIGRTSIDVMASKFFSVQSLHPPLSTAIAVSSKAPTDKNGGSVQVKNVDQAQLASLPCVAVVDTGIPSDHPILKNYRRNGGFRSPNSSAPYLGNHGSFVASRIVFGDVDCSGGKLPEGLGDCRFFDVMVAETPNRIFDKDLVTSLNAVTSTSPDVRVFNLSLGDTSALSNLGEVERREKLLLVQDLDNFVFARDVVVVLAAGNSPQGLSPSVPYPNHFDDPNWALGGLASGFNTLTCGSTVERISVDGLVKEIGWPSPFTRIGPGICGAPIPEFSAHGGNTTESYQPKPHLGVWGCTADGQWEDSWGTSHAAPLLAREAAFVLQELQSKCVSGARPFAATVKAFLALTAERKSYPPQVNELVDRTLGRGTASAIRLRKPSGQTAVMIWQGVLNSAGDIARVRVPIPREWHKAASAPRLRILCAWDSPVYEAVRDIWACRKVAIHLRATPSSKAIMGSHSQHHSYPLIDRTFDLDSKKLSDKGIKLENDLAVLEVSYSQEADYYPAITFSPQQKIGLSIELFDASAQPISPQPFVQSLPIATTMTRLSIQPVPLATPILIRQ